MNEEIQKQKIRRLSRYLLAAALLWALPVSTIAAGPLKLSSHAFEVGTVKEGVTIKKNVTLENTGNEEVAIKNISTS